MEAIGRSFSVGDKIKNKYSGEYKFIVEIVIEYGVVPAYRLDDGMIRDNNQMYQWVKASKGVKR